MQYCDREMTRQGGGITGITGRAGEKEEEEEEEEPTRFLNLSFAEQKDLRQREVDLVHVHVGDVHDIVGEYLEYYGFGNTLAAYNRATRARKDTHHRASDYDSSRDGCDVNSNNNHDSSDVGENGTSCVSIVRRIAPLGVEVYMQCNEAVPLFSPPASCTPLTDASLTTSLQQRTELRHLVMAGEIDTVLEILQSKYPGCVEDESNGVSFAVQCQRFLELVRRDELEEAVVFAQEHLGRLNRKSVAQEMALQRVKERHANGICTF